jgi:hypothetical protein
MEPLLGPADNQYFAALVKAPAAWGQIMADANVAQFTKRLASADKAFADTTNFVRNYLALRQNATRFAPGAIAVIDEYRNSDVLKRFDFFARAYQLRSEWKLDPELMQELNQAYGPIDWNDPNKHLPLDWRHPDVHAIYWAVKGLRIAGTKGRFEGGRKQYSIDEMNTDRMVAHSLQDLFLNGRIYIYDIPSDKVSTDLPPGSQWPNKDIYLRPDFRMFMPYDRQLQEIIRKYTEPNDIQLNSHQTGHRNMLEDVVMEFYQAGHERQAQQIFDEMRTLYPSDKTKVSLLVFVRRNFIEKLKGLVVRDAKGMIQSILRESYFLYAMHDDDQAFDREKLAGEVYDLYNQQNEPSIRIDLPELSRLKFLGLQDFLSDGEYVPSLRESLLSRIKIERPELFKKLDAQRMALQKEHGEQLRKNSEKQP